MITVRKVEPEDIPMIQEWAERRGCDLHPALLSPHGFLAEWRGKPVLALWGYMLLDVPVIALDHLFSRPRTSASVIRKAMAKLIEIVRDWIRRLNEMGGVDYRIIRTFINSRLSVEAERLGWKPSGSYTQAILTYG